MSEPLASTSVVTITWPTLDVPDYEQGQVYTSLVSAAEDAFQPLDDIAADTSGLVSEDPQTYANTIVGDVSTLWAYLGYGANLEPALVSLGLLLGAFFTVMIVKLVLVVVMYVKNLVANWL
jgi:hypothetical protein